VRPRWFSRQAISLHLAALVFVPGCAVAAWWQVNRAADGNQLSYLYSVMWPVFGLLGILFWWLLLHTDYDNVGLKGMRRQAQQEAAGAETAGIDPAGAAPAAPTAVPTPTPTPPPLPTVNAEEDPELAAYNARLAELAAKGPKTWRNRETVVARRPQ
jgi:hypothetical protein